jgi:hypothetical protein
MLSGPRRAQAQKQVAHRIGPIPGKERGLTAVPYKAHAVTSRVTSWANWYALSTLWRPGRRPEGISACGGGISRTRESLATSLGNMRGLSDVGFSLTIHFGARSESRGIYAVPHGPLLRTQSGRIFKWTFFLRSLRPLKRTRILRIWLGRIPGGGQSFSPRRMNSTASSTET